MIASLTKSLIAAAVVLLAAQMPQHAQAGEFLPWAWPNDGESRACDDAKVLRAITRRFQHQVTHVPHLPDVKIVDYDRIHEHRYLPATEKRPIARRYCMATAEFASGERHSVWYLIEDGMGFSSIGDGVEFCVSGFDRWNVYNSGCRILR